MNHYQFLFFPFCFSFLFLKKAKKRGPERKKKGVILIVVLNGPLIRVIKDRQEVFLLMNKGEILGRTTPCGARPKFRNIVVFSFKVLNKAHVSFF